MSKGLSVKSGGVPCAPTRANALPGSDRLVPKTTMPEKRDCAVAIPAASRWKRMAAIRVAVSRARVFLEKLVMSSPGPAELTVAGVGAGRCDRWILAVRVRRKREGFVQNPEES